MEISINQAGKQTRTHACIHSHTHEFTQPLAVTAHPGRRHLSPSPQTSLPSHIPHPCPLPLRCPGSLPGSSWQAHTAANQSGCSTTTTALRPGSLIPPAVGCCGKVSHHKLLIMLCYYVLSCVIMCCVIIRNKTDTNHGQDGIRSLFMPYTIQYRQ